MAEVRDQAAEFAPDALGVLVELMRDQQQTGPVRVAAAKGVIDYAQKLADRDRDDTLSKLDAALEDLRSAFMEGDQGS